MKQVIQLDKDGYFVGFTTADESPLEPGVWLFPAGTIEAPAPQIPEGHNALWEDGSWKYVPIPTDPQPDESEVETLEMWRETTEVSRFQARVALYNFGLFDTVNQALSAPDAPFLAKEAWASASVFRRLSPTVTAMAGILGLTDEQLDELFRAAKEIKA